MKLSWVQAVKLYHQQNGTKYKVPRKGTPEYTAVKKLMANSSTEKPKMSGEAIKMPNIVNEILEELDMSKASELTKQIIEKHLKEATREIKDTFVGNGIDDLVGLVPKVVSKMPTISKKVIDKGLEVVKDAKEGVESAQQKAKELHSQWNNVKNAVDIIVKEVKKSKKTITGKGLNQLGKGLGLNEIMKFVPALDKIFSLVKQHPKLSSIVSNVNLKTKDPMKLIGDITNIGKAVNKAKTLATQELNKILKMKGKGLVQLGNGLNQLGRGKGQQGGFLPFLIPFMPAIVSALSAAGAAAGTAAAGVAGARVASGVVNAIEGKPF